jgi:hypothetical protein
MILKYLKKNTKFAADYNLKIQKNLKTSFSGAV